MRFLIVRPDRLGDVILSLPVAEILKQHYPQSTITYLAAPGPAQIAPMASYVDRWIIDGDSRGQFGLSRLMEIIKAGQFDCALELKPSPRTATALLLAGIPIRIGTMRRGYSFLYNRYVNIHRRGSGRHQTDLELEMLTSLGIKVSGALPRLELAPDAIARAKALVGEIAGRYIVIHPGSGGSAPNWPFENYRKLAALIAASELRGVVITGHNDLLGNFHERCVNLNGKTDMQGLAGIIAGADLFISGSTGPLHLADALGIRCMPFFIRHPVVGPERWGPRRNLENVLMPPYQCRCRRLDQCDCLGKITPEDAMIKLKSILDYKA